MMHRLLIPLALILAASNLFGQTEAQGPNQIQKPKPEGNCTVSGRVISAADGSPLRSARVGLVQREERKHPQIYGATTDNEGRFEIKEIVAGRYLFFAAHSGYLEREYKATKSGVGEGAILSLFSGQEVTDVVFRLVRAAIITGRVVDDKGEPMTGVNVSVLRNPTEDEKEDMGPNAKKSELQSVSVGVTDDRGEYRIFGLDPGDYYVKASETGEPQGGRLFGESSWLMQELGSLYAPLYYPGILQLSQAQTVSLRAGDELQADFSMRRVKTTEVSGRVIGVDGSPTNRAFVNLMAADESDYGGQMSKNTDDKGEFTFKGVSPGSYVLEVQQYDPDVRCSVRRKVEVAEEKVDSIVIPLGRGATIRGRIVASGSGAGTFGRVYVRLETTSESDTATPTGTQVKKDSSFEFTGVSDGSYAFHAHVLEPGWFVKSAHLGNEDVLEKGLQVENGTVSGSLEVVISSGIAQLEGTVTDNEQNQPLAGVQVRARSDPPSEFNRYPWNQASTDQNGHYVIKDVPPGKYKVTARIPSPGEGAPAIRSDPVPVTLGEREHQTVDIKLAVPKSE